LVSLQVESSRAYILKINNLLLGVILNIEAIYANVFGELMLHWVLSNADSTSTIKVHECRGGESKTKVSQEPP
jgi:hypothetical protein